MIKRGGVTDWTEPGQRTVGGCVLDPKLSQSSEGDLGHSKMKESLSQSLCGSRGALGFKYSKRGNALKRLEEVSGLLQQTNCVHSSVVNGAKWSCCLIWLHKRLNVQCNYSHFRYIRWSLKFSFRGTSKQKRAVAHEQLQNKTQKLVLVVCDIFATIWYIEHPLYSNI